MTLPNTIFLATLIIDFFGTFMLSISVIVCFIRYIIHFTSVDKIESLRVELAKTIVFALTFKTGAGILRSILVNSWEHFFLFTSIILLRFFLAKTLNINNKVAIN